MNIQPGKPILVCIGGNACRIGSSFDIDNTLFLDTDRRTHEGLQKENILLVGQEIVHGEGSGGNINLARASFRKEMDRIGQIILKRPLVIILADVSGATSVAGAVELNSLLVRVGLPSVVFLITEGEGRIQTRNSSLMARTLLDGPLRPGVNLKIRYEGGSVPGFSEDELSRMIGSLLISSSDWAEVSIPPTSWLLLRENGGPFCLSFHRIQRGSDRKKDILQFGQPCIAVMKVPRNVTTKEINDILSDTFASMKSVTMGVLGSLESGQDCEIFAITPTPEGDSNPDGPDMSARGAKLEEMIGYLDDQNMGPGMDL